MNMEAVDGQLERDVQTRTEEDEVSGEKEGDIFRRSRRVISFFFFS